MGARWNGCWRLLMAGWFWWECQFCGFRCSNTSGPLFRLLDHWSLASSISGKTQSELEWISQSCTKSSFLSSQWKLTLKKIVRRKAVNSPKSPGMVYKLLFEWTVIRSQNWEQILNGLLQLFRRISEDRLIFRIILLRLIRSKWRPDLKEKLIFQIMHKGNVGWWDKSLKIGIKNRMTRTRLKLFKSSKLRKNPRERFWGPYWRISSIGKCLSVTQKSFWNCSGNAYTS